MSAPQWLKSYYGEQYSEFNPEIVLDGNRYAVVKIFRPQTNKQMYSSVGYVLLRKGGCHEGASHQSLHEGIPTVADMSKMQAALQKADG